MANDGREAAAATTANRNATIGRSSPCLRGAEKYVRASTRFTTSWLGLRVIDYG
jgi:hypothetical protein